MQTVPTDRDSGPTIPPVFADALGAAVAQALGVLESSIALVDTYSRLYNAVVEPHFGPTGEDCPQGREVERASGVGLIGDIMAEAAEAIMERLGGTGSRGLTIDQYRAEAWTVALRLWPALADRDGAR